MGLGFASLVGAGLILAAWTVISTVRQYFRLRHFKGPPTSGLSKWWLMRSVGGGRTHLDLYEVCEKYGGLATLQVASQSEKTRPKKRVS